MNNEELYSDYKWIKVKRYKMDETKSWEDRYKDLDDHHIKETSFLIEEVRSLAKKLDAVTVSEEKVKKKQERDEGVRSFFVMWFGFAFLVQWIASWFVEPHQHTNIILAVSLLLGGICSFFFLRWTKRGKKTS